MLKIAFIYRVVFKQDTKSIFLCTWRHNWLEDLVCLSTTEMIHRRDSAKNCLPSLKLIDWCDFAVITFNEPQSKHECPRNWQKIHSCLSNHENVCWAIFETSICRAILFVKREIWLISEKWKRICSRIFYRRSLTISSERQPRNRYEF